MWLMIMSLSPSSKDRMEPSISANYEITLKRYPALNIGREKEKSYPFISFNLLMKFIIFW